MSDTCLPTVLSVVWDARRRGTARENATAPNPLAADAHRVASAITPPTRSLSPRASPSAGGRVPSSSRYEPVVDGGRPPIDDGVGDLASGWL